MALKISGMTALSGNPTMDDLFEMTDPQATSPLTYVTRKATMQQLRNATTVIQQAVTTWTSSDDTTSQIPADDTIPQSGEGEEIASLATTITPKRTDTYFEIEVFIPLMSISAAGTIVGAIFRDSGADAIGVSSLTIHAATYQNQFIVRAWVPSSISSPLALSATTFKFRYGPTSAITAYANQSSAGARFSTANVAMMTVREILTG